MTRARGGLRAETIAITSGREPPLPDGPLNVPLVLASSFHAGGSTPYAREGNPTWTAFEQAVGALEGGDAVSFSSGMGAIAAILEDVPLGGRVVLPTVAYMEVRSLLRQRADADRLEAVQVDITDTEVALHACEGAALLWIESPTNPLLGVADMAALCQGARRLGALAVVDSTLATPILQRPLTAGADVVLHSATKFIGGHSDLLLGVAITSDERRAARLRQVREMTGGTPGSLEAWLALRGIRTLPLRIAQAQTTAQVLAERLSAHPAVVSVRYPGLSTDPGHQRAARDMDGFGAMLAFEVSGGAPRADAVCASVRVLTHATSLGGVETLIERRARWPAEAGISPSLLRVSVGCEHVEDLWTDLERALATPP